MKFIAVVLVAILVVLPDDTGAQNGCSVKLKNTDGTEHVAVPGMCVPHTGDEKCITLCPTKGKGLVDIWGYDPVNHPPDSAEYDDLPIELTATGSCTSDCCCFKKSKVV